jgi:hypothetical protein
MNDHLAQTVTVRQQDQSLLGRRADGLRRFPLPVRVVGVVGVLGLVALLLVRSMAYALWPHGVPFIVRAGLVAALAQVGFGATRYLVETSRSRFR